MFSISKKIKAFLVVAICVCVPYLLIPFVNLFRGQTTLHVHQRYVHFKDFNGKRQEIHTKRGFMKQDMILTDLFLNIEREGKFPEDDPCPYLGVRKPIREGRYPNNYYGISCKPHRPEVKDCETAREIFGSTSNLLPQKCKEFKYKELCTFRANKTVGNYDLECDWSICLPHKPNIAEMNPTYGRPTRWIYAPTDRTIEEIILRSKKNGFNFVLLKCGSLQQVLPLPIKLKLSRKTPINKKINVNIILIDSISRPHFYRSMPRTIEALRHVVYNESIPATVLDFELFQSVSQHTMDNCRPLYSGVTSGVYKEFSSKWRRSIKPLGIPVLFGEYQKSGYQTMFQEEGCWYDLWGLMLTDVERHPVPTDMDGFAKRWKQLQKKWKHYHIDDFGLTHFTCEVVRKYGLTNDLDRPAQVCFNGDFISTYYLKYHLDYLRSIREHKDSLPLLNYLHLITGHTSTGTRIRNDDVGLAKYVTELARDPNTLTIILSDHGHTRTRYAQTVEGRFELSNPLMFVMLSENVAKVLGKNKVRSLVENQRRLFTTLDIHRMLMALNNPVKMRSDDYRVNGILSVLPSNRTCENLPLTPLTRCKCEGWDQKFEDNSQRHIWLAEFALGQLNNMIQEQFMKRHKNGGYGSCIRLRGLETKNIIEKQSEKRLSVTMDLIVESALPNTVELFQVLIETPLLPDENIASAKLVKYDRQTLYNRYVNCVDDGVDIRLCACAKKTTKKDTIASDALRSLAIRSTFGAETEVTLVDEEGCLLMLSRKHNFSISYEVANVCEKTYHFAFFGDRYNMLLTAELPVLLTVKPRTIYFLVSAIRYVVNDSYFDVRTSYRILS